ncbi:unnamed protein product [Closterium sp. NIES-54]
MLGEGEQRSFMVVYVDDILIFSPSSDLVKEVMVKLQDKFKCKALGDVSFYLGLHIERDVEKRCMRVHQRKYLEALVATFGQSEGHVATPFPSGFKCVKGPEEESVGEEERRHFHSLVGSLMYAAVNTRPDVAFATGQLARVVQCPNEEQVAAGMRVAKYLGQTATDMTSVGGFICCVGGGPTAWESKNQVDQALSSVESEYMALFRAVREIVWQRRLLAELGEEQQGPTPLYCDSQGAIALAKNPVLHGLTKHMRVKWHWTRSMVAAGEVELHYVKTTGQPADMMTKRLVEQQHWKKVGDASAFRVLGSRAFVHDLCADKLSPRAVPCVFLGFPPDAPGWLFYHPTSRRVLSSQDVTFDESVDVVVPVEVAVDSGAARGAEPVGAGSGGAESGGAEPGGAEPGGAEPGGAESGVAEPWGAEPGGAESARVASRCASSRRELLSPQELCGWFARRWSRAARARGPPVASGPGGARTGGTGAVGTGGAAAAAGVGFAGASRAAGAGAAGGVGAGVGPAEVGAVGARSAAGTGAATGGTGAVPVGTGGPARPRPYFVPLLEQVLGLSPSPGPAPLLECPQPVQSPVSPLHAPSPYAGPTGGLAERREPASRPASPVRTTRTSRRAPRPRPPAVPGTHQMTLRPSTTPLRVPLPSPPKNSLPVLADPESDSFRAASPTVARLLCTVVTYPSFESTAATALVVELVDFAARCRLDYTTRLVAESASVCPPSVGGECALSTDVLEDREEEFQCFAAALPHLVSTLIAPEGNPDAPDISTPRSYAEAIEGPYSSQWQSAMDAEMASWKSTGTYVDEVPPRGANIVSGMWIFRVKRPPGSPPVLKARYVARGFTQRDYELHSLDFSTAFPQGSLHEEIWLRHPPGFTGSFPAGTQWSLRRPVYGLRQAPREWHDTLRTTLAALGFAPSTADPSLFLRTDTSLPPFYILVYVDNLVFATGDTAGLAHVKSELQKRHTCTDLGELRSYLGLQITQDRSQRTITLTQSHMVQQVLQRFDFTYSSPQATPLSTRHSLSALPSDESVEPSGPYPELVGCLIHRPEHMAAAKRVLRYLCSTSGLGLVLGGQRPVVLTGHTDASWADDQATQRSSQGYTFSLGSGSVSWRSTRSSSVLGSSYNKAMLALCREHRLEHRTKHIALRYFLARELQQRGQLRLAYVAYEANTADIFTKALAPGDHQRFCTMLGFPTSVDFEVWVDDLQLFLQCDSKDGLSLFDLTSGTSTAPTADADSTVRSQWLTRDAAARLAVHNHLPSTERAHFSQYKSARALYNAVVARYSSPTTAALSHLMLPYLFPDLAAFAIVADLVAHLRTSDARYRAALPTEFLPTNSPPMYITHYYLLRRVS